MHTVRQALSIVITVAVDESISNALFVACAQVGYHSNCSNVGQAPCPHKTQILQALLACQPLVLTGSNVLVVLINPIRSEQRVDELAAEDLHSVVV